MFLETMADVLTSTKDLEAVRPASEFLSDLAEGIVFPASAVEPRFDFGPAKQDLEDARLHFEQFGYSGEASAAWLSAKCSACAAIGGIMVAMECNAFDELESPYTEVEEMYAMTYESFPGVTIKK